MIINDNIYQLSFMNHFSGQKSDQNKFRTKTECRKRSRFGTFSDNGNVRNLYDYYSGQFPDIFWTFFFYREVMAK